MITAGDLDKLAGLARIRLDRAAREAMAGEFGAILAYVDRLKEAGAPPDAGGGPGIAGNVSRPDQPRPASDEGRERLLAEVPDREGDFVAVKKVIARD